MQKRIRGPGSFRRLPSLSPGSFRRGTKGKQNRQVADGMRFAYSLLPKFKGGYFQPQSRKVIYEMKRIIVITLCAVGVHSEESKETSRAKKIFQEAGAEDISSSGEAAVAKKDR
jgi:hypothetical protein